MFSILRKRFKYEIIFKICGAISIAAFIISIILLYLAITNSSNLNFSKNWLSDLGSAPIQKTNDIRPTVNNFLTELYFNIWLKTLSILGLIFGIGLEIYFLKKDIKNHFSHIGAFLYILGAGFLFLIALFPQSYPFTHKMISLTTTISMIISIIIITFSAIKNKQIKKISSILIILSSFVILFIPGIVGELIIIFSILYWTLLFGIILLRTEYQI